MITQEMKKKALNQMVKAGQLNQILYKYRSNGEFTEKIFTDHTLWFDHPKNFNDPFDCWANVQDLTPDDLKAIIDYSNRSEYEKTICKEGISSYTNEMLKQDVDNALNGIGVSCFGKTEKSILMWSHYSDYHKGICLGFDVFEDPDFFTLAKPVNYVNSMTQYNHITDRTQLIEKIIQPKAMEWVYEEEIRIIKTNDMIMQNGNSQAFKFKPTALKKVIFGCKATNDTIVKYQELCKQNGLEHVFFSQMHQKKNGQFELDEIRL